MNVKTVIDKTLDTLLVIILGIMSILVAINVFSRFVLNSSIYWGDELAMALFVWLTFLGAAIGIREKVHYVFGYFSDKLKGTWLKAYTLAGDILTLIAILILLYYSTQVTLQINKWIMPAMEVSRALVYGAAPIGCLFMLYYMVIRLKSQLKKKQE